ncbi:MAG: hypothetical protein ACPGRX_01940 [Bdellovibrionales bacterium]
MVDSISGSGPVSPVQKLQKSQGAGIRDAASAVEAAQGSDTVRVSSEALELQARDQAGAVRDALSNNIDLTLSRDARVLQRLA